MAKRLEIKKITKIYMAVFGILMLIYCAINVPSPTGEWDDYSLPIASIFNDGNLSVSEDDVLYYKELFPDWRIYIENYSLSGYKIHNGSAELPWYFPTYSIVCIPIVLALQLLELPTIYTFPFTNLALLLGSVYILNKWLKAGDKRKLIMVLALTLNPIVFYLGWASAEVFIYSMMVIGLTCWYNKWYRRAALFISIAGMLNPTIMSVGIVMIVEYIYNLLKNKNREQSWISFFKQNILETVKYGCCYIIGIVPMIYNYYYTGYINLTASLTMFTSGNETTFSRFIAYLFDLNYGILPYFTGIFALSIVILAFAVTKKKFRYIEWLITFFINVALYSVMVHINSGMAGIARYNAWGAAILIFAVVLIGVDSLPNGKAIKGSCAVLGLGITLTTITVFLYGPNLASNTSYFKFTPIAEYALEHFSWLYNPLKSTFCSRTMSVDGGYAYETPIVYTAKDGYVRKILAAEKDKEALLNEYASYSGMNGFEKQVKDLQDTGYISLSANDAIYKKVKYEVGTTLGFTKDDTGGLSYVVKGMSEAEEWGTWSDGNEIIVRMCIDSQDISSLHCEIDGSVFNEVQDITISANGNIVYRNAEYRGGKIEFDFEKVKGESAIEFVFELPNAISTQKLGFGDSRALGIGISKMIITENRVG